MSSDRSADRVDQTLGQTRTVTHFLDRVWNRGLIEECDQLIHDDYEIPHDPGDPGDGRLLTSEEFKQRVPLSPARVPDQRFDIVDAFKKEGSVLVAWTWVGTHHGDRGGAPATGRKLTMSGATIYSLQEGRISGHWQVADRIGIARQLMANQEASK